MATFHLIEPYADMSGKICSHSRIINVLGRKGVRKGNQWTSVICNPRNYDEHPKTALETKAQERFADVRLTVKGIKTNPTKLANAYEAYAAVRDNYKSFNSYLWKTECANWNTEHGSGGAGGPVEE